MTRVRIAVCILAALILMSTGSVFIVRYSCERVIAVLGELRAAEVQGNTEQAQQLCGEAYDKWSDMQAVLMFCVSYDKLSEADNTLCRLSPMLDADCDEFRAELAAAETMLRHIAEGETPYLTNVF